MSDRRERKAARKAVEAKKLMEEQMLKHPEWCYCEEVLHKLADVDFENDKPIGQTEPVDGFPYWNSTGHTQDIYRCKRCGKQYCQSIVFASPNTLQSNVEDPANDELAKRNILGNILKDVQRIIAEKGIFGKANYVTVPVVYIEKVAKEYNITYEEASDRIRDYFAEHIN